MAHNLVFLALAYTAIWAILFGYMFLIDRRLVSARNEMAALKRQLDREGVPRS